MARSPEDPSADVSEVADGAAATAPTPGPRRSGLLQERSRRTRRDLVDAALRLWSARGFDSGIDETTVEEIAREAGVTKGTFYFHFAHKEDILLEVGFGTAQAMFREASEALASDEPVETVLDGLLTSLARRISQSPRAAVARTLAEFYRRPAGVVDVEATDEHFGFQRSFSVVFFHAQQAGQLPANTDARVLGETLSAMVIGAVNSWICGSEPELAPALRHRAQLLVGGVRQLGSQRPYPS